MNFRAILFDYFGTLTVATPAAVRRAGAGRVAAALGVDPELFFGTISLTFTERSTGRYGDLHQTMEWLARRCGGRPSEGEVAEACTVRREIEGTYARQVRADAVATLRLLRDRGLRIGVISDCTHELPELWPSLAVAPWVDASVFSITMGERKPHPSLYRAACAGLDVGIDEVGYVGDGGSNELSGARALGIPAVRLVADDGVDALVYDAEEEWTGPVIGSLAALRDRPLPALFGLPDESTTTGDDYW